MQTSDRPFRFGVTLLDAAGREDWEAKCRRAETLGYDVVSVPDHLGMVAPFPALVRVAECTERVRVATAVLNTSFYPPALLARDVVTTAVLTSGRLEVGLGTGYARAEFEAAGLAWPPAAERLDRLERTVTCLRSALAAGPGSTSRTGVPLFIGARGDATVRLACRHADIVGFTAAAAGADGSAPALDDTEALAERVDFARALLGVRAPAVELNFQFAKVLPVGDRRALTGAPELASPALLAGTPARMAADVRALRDRFGFTYFTVTEPDLDAFAPVVEHLR